MSYTTVSGTLTGDTVWTAGTYYLSGNVSLSSYNLTLNCSAGNIVIKTAGDKQIVLNGSGDLLSSNTGVNNKVIFTSKNDDAHGEAISGSSGTPVSADQSVPYTTVTFNGCVFNMAYFEAWYVENIEKGVFCWGDQPLGSFNNNVTIKFLKLKYCKIVDGSSGGTALIGMYRRTGIGTVILENIEVDDTNSITNSSDESTPSVIAFLRPTIWNMSNLYINALGSMYCMVRVSSSTSGTHTHNFKNFVLKYCGSGPAGTCGIYASISAGGTLILNMEDIILDGINKSCSGINVGIAEGTATVNIKNSIFVNWNAGIDRHVSSGTLILTENNNGFYNNIIDSDLPLDPSDIVADPQFISAPDNVIINSNDCPIPDGYFIGNLADYEKKGSNTFDNLSIDEAIYSATGYRYAGTDKVTPGVNYSLTQFYLYGVTFVEGAHGAIVGNKTQMINYGENCSKVIASPDDGYDFSSWSGDRTSNDDAFTVTNVTSDLTIRANFSQQFTRQKIHENRGNNECVIDSTDGSFHPGRTRFHVRQNVSFR